MDQGLIYVAWGRWELLLVSPCLGHKKRHRAPIRKSAVFPVKTACFTKDSEVDSFLPESQVGVKGGGEVGETGGLAVSPEDIICAINPALNMRAPLFPSWPRSWRGMGRKRRHTHTRTHT